MKKVLKKFWRDYNGILDTRLWCEPEQPLWFVALASIATAAMFLIPVGLIATAAQIWAAWYYGY